MMNHDVAKLKLMKIFVNVPIIPQFILFGGPHAAVQEVISDSVLRSIIFQIKCTNVNRLEREYGG